MVAKNLGFWTFRFIHFSGTNLVVVAVVIIIIKMQYFVTTEDPEPRLWVDTFSCSSQR